MFDVFILWEHVQTISGGMVCLCLHLGIAFWVTHQCSTHQWMLLNPFDITPLKINMEHNHGGSVQIIFLNLFWNTTMGDLCDL